MVASCYLFIYFNSKVVTYAWIFFLGPKITTVVWGQDETQVRVV